MRIHLDLELNPEMGNRAFIFIFLRSQKKRGGPQKVSAKKVTAPSTKEKNMNLRFSLPLPAPHWKPVPVKSCRNGEKHGS
jgi:hypothetical protein